MDRSDYHERVIVHRRTCSSSMDRFDMGFVMHRLVIAFTGRSSARSDSAKTAEIPSAKYLAQSKADRATPTTEGF